MRHAGYAPHLAIGLCALAALASAQQPAPRPDVSGVTLDSKGQPLRKVNLTLLPLATNPEGEPLPPYGATSENDGKFVLYDVPPGRYRLMAERPGYLKTYFGARNSWATGAVLTLRPGAPLAGIVVRMNEQSVISGMVLHDGSPTGVIVSLLQQRYRDGRRQLTSIATTSANASGEFSFNKLPRGRYYLVAYGGYSAPPEPAPGLRPERYARTYYPGTIDPGAAEPIELKRAETLSDVAFPLRKSMLFRIGGTVSGYASGSGRVFVYARSTTQSVSALSSASVAPDGTFRIDSLPPGVYSITAIVSSASSSELAHQTVEVSHDVDGIVLTAEQLPALHGAVKVEGGPPAVPNLRIRLAPADGFGFFIPNANVNSDGSFTLSGVSAGRSRIEIQDLPAGAYLKSATLGEKDALAGVDFDQRSADAKLTVVVSYAGARVAGAVRGEDGKPVDAVVTLIPDPPRPDQASLYQVADTAENGLFQLQGIRPGKYRLYAWEELEPGSHLDPQVTAPLQAWSVPIEAAENDHKQIAIRRITVDAMEAAAKPPAR
jgi:hypothetical protein